MNRFVVRKSGAAAAAILCPALLAFTVANATAASPGSIVVEGKTSTLTSAYAYHHPAAYDAAVIQTTVVVSDKAIDTKKVKAAGGDFDKALHAWLDEAKAGDFLSGRHVVERQCRFARRASVRRRRLRRADDARNGAKRVEGACHTVERCGRTIAKTASTST